MPKRRYVDTIPGGAHAIVTLDPASAAKCGIAIRRCDNLLSPDRKRVRSPSWFYSGSVWNTVMHDDFAFELGKMVPRGGRVLFVASCTAYYGAGYDIGRATGCIEGLLHDLNIMGDDRVRDVTDQEWRKAMYSDKAKAAIKATGKGGSKERRDAFKAHAISEVKRLHRIDCDDNAAEAILMNDFVVLHRGYWYAP